MRRRGRYQGIFGISVKVLFWFFFTPLLFLLEMEITSLDRSHFDNCRRIMSTRQQSRGKSTPWRISTSSSIVDLQSGDGLLLQLLELLLCEVHAVCGSLLH